MRNFSIARTSDLPPIARQALESLLGRQLSDDEEVSVWASTPHKAPVAESRDKAWKELHQQFASISRSSVPDEEAEHIADEVAQEVRHP